MNEASVQTSSNGTATTQFNQPTGVYNLVISYVDEKEGQGSISVIVGGNQKATWKLDEDVDCWRRKTIPNVKIKNGEEIKIVGVANGSESARVDFIEYILQAVSKNNNK